MSRRMAIPLATALALAVFPGDGAEAAGLEEEVRALYANRFGFDRRGVPLISIQIMEGQGRVTLGAPGGLRLQTHGTDATHLAGATQWTVTLQQGQPARTRHWVVVDSHRGVLDEGNRRRILAQWKSRGFAEARTLEVGALFAVGGHVVDNRVTLVMTDPDSSPAVAEAKARQIAAKIGRPTTLHRELLRRPTGILTAQPLGSSLQLVSQDVLWFSPVVDGQLTVKRVEFGKGYRWHGFKDRRYLGRVYVTVDRRGQLAVVNEVPADRLLFGLVPAEIYTSAPLDALKAQAVAARGQLLAKIGTRHTTDPYRICSSQHCQVYSGAGHEHARTTQAVEETRGLILVDAQGRLADTVYSANAGGHTEHNEHVWGTPPNPSLRGQLDVSPEDARRLGPFSRGINEQNIRAWLLASPPAFSNRATMGALGRFRWTARMDQAEMDRRVKARFGPPMTRVLRVEIMARGVSGRATAVRIHAERPGGAIRHEVHGELAIRRLFGNLKSSMFVVDHQRGPGRRTDFVFRGGGWGHGVGMCQTGAIGMAEVAHDFRAILGHYYPQTRLLKLY